LKALVNTDGELAPGAGAAPTGWAAMLEPLTATSAKIKAFNSEWRTTLLFITEPIQVMTSRHHGIPARHAAADSTPPTLKRVF